MPARPGRTIGLQDDGDVRRPESMQQRQERLQEDDESKEPEDADLEVGAAAVAPPRRASRPSDDMASGKEGARLSTFFSNSTPPGKAGPPVVAGQMLALAAPNGAVEAFSNTRGKSSGPGAYPMNYSPTIAGIPPRRRSSGPSDHEVSWSSATRRVSSPGALRVGGAEDSSGEIEDAQTKTDSLIQAIEAELAPESAEDLDAIVEERIRQRDNELTVAAEVSPEETDVCKVKRGLAFKTMLLMFSLLAAAVAVIVVVFKARKKGESNIPEQPLPQIPTGPTLEEVQERGILRCGLYESNIGFSFHDKAAGVMEGILVDICHALAKVVLGDPDKVEFVFVTSSTRFTALQNRTIDVLSQTATVTMGRDVFEPKSKSGLTFSVPFTYSGMAFAGLPNYVDCADNLDSFTGACRDLKICFMAGTTHETVLLDIFPGPERFVTSLLQDAVTALENGQCHVLVGDAVAITESHLGALGYTKPYKLGVNRFTKEPLGIVTRDGDREWSSLANLIINVLFTAEALGITKDSIKTIDLASISGLEEDDKFTSLFVDIVSTIGNMGELYTRHLEPIFPREGLNLLNMGGDINGLVYSFPFGDLSREGGGGLFAGGVVASILARGNVRCGVASDSPTAAFDQEMCIALSAALFSAQDASTTVDFVDLVGISPEDRLAKLAQDEVDVLAGERVLLRNTWKDEIPNTRIRGYTYSPPYYYDSEDGNSFALATRQEEDAQWSDFVYWVVMSLFHAEENQLGQDASTELPVVGLFGERLRQMFLDTIFAVGNYGDMYNRTIAASIPRSGRNLINQGGTPQQIGYPIV